MDINFKELKGKIIVISGSSGSGKGTLISKYIENNPEIYLSISATTRPIRHYEKHGQDYYFLSEEEFKDKIQKDLFFEWAFNHKQFYYGTPKEHIIDALKKGKNIIMEINYEGFQKIKKIIPEQNLISIFILPPSKEVLIKRIKKRADISDEEIENRLNYSLKKEIEISPQYKHQFEPIDGDIEKTYKEFETLIYTHINSVSK